MRKKTELIIGFLLIALAMVIIAGFMFSWAFELWRIVDYVAIGILVASGIVLLVRRVSVPNEHPETSSEQLVQKKKQRFKRIIWLLIIIAVLVITIVTIYMLTGPEPIVQRDYPGEFYLMEGLEKLQVRKSPNSTESVIDNADSLILSGYRYDYDENYQVGLRDGSSSLEFGASYLPKDTNKDETGKIILDFNFADFWIRGYIDGYFDGCEQSGRNCSEESQSIENYYIGITPEEFDEFDFLKKAKESDTPTIDL